MCAARKSISKVNRYTKAEIERFVKESGLTAKRRKFCDLFFKYGDAYRAAREAGYAEGRIRNIYLSDLLKNEAVGRYLDMAHRNKGIEPPPAYAIKMVIGKDMYEHKDDGIGSKMSADVVDAATRRELAAIVGEGGDSGDTVCCPESQGSGEAVEIPAPPHAPVSVSVEPGIGVPERPAKRGAGKKKSKENGNAESPVEPGDGMGADSPEGPDGVVGNSAGSTIDLHDNSIGCSMADVLSEYRKIAFASMADLVSWNGQTLEVRDFSTISADKLAAISEINIDNNGNLRVKLHDKKNALDVLEKHFAAIEAEKREERALARERELRRGNDDGSDGNPSAKVKEAIGNPQMRVAMERLYRGLYMQDGDGDNCDDKFLKNVNKVIEDMGTPHDSQRRDRQIGYDGEMTDDEQERIMDDLREFIN